MTKFKRQVKSSSMLIWALISRGSFVLFKMAFSRLCDFTRYVKHNAGRSVNIELLATGLRLLTSFVNHTRKSRPSRKICLSRNIYQNYIEIAKPNIFTYCVIYLGRKEFIMSEILILASKFYSCSKRTSKYAYLQRRPYKYYGHSYIL